MSPTGGERPKCSVDGCGRLNHAGGLCGPHYRLSKGYRSKPKTRSENAEAVLRRGGALAPPRSLPFRALARTCEQCGDLITTPAHLVKKDAGPLPPCHACHIRAVRRVVVKRQAIDEDFRIKIRRRSDQTKARLNRKTLETAGRAGQQWTGAELEIVAREDLTARQVADMLGRSYYAVKHARQKLKDPKWIPVAGIPNREEWKP